MQRAAHAAHRHHAARRVLALLGDSVTTDHISPAGNIAKDEPARAVPAAERRRAEDFNSYGSRRGNHEVMVRGTFANMRLKQPVAATASRAASPATSPTASQMSIYDASMQYQADRIPLS